MYTRLSAFDAAAALKLTNTSEALTQLARNVYTGVGAIDAQQTSRFLHGLDEAVQTLSDDADVEVHERALRAVNGDLNLILKFCVAKPEKVRHTELVIACSSAGQEVTDEDEERHALIQYINEQNVAVNRAVKFGLKLAAHIREQKARNKKRQAKRSTIRSYRSN